MSYFEFPHTRTYEGDLGYIIKEVIELKERYNTFFKYNTIKFSDPIEWDITRQYPPFMIVFDTQNESSYISKRPVPAGITLDNSDFWEYIGSLLVDGYARLMIERVMKSISGNFESTLVCTQNRIDGDFIVIAGDIFKATSNITVGQPYVVGLNVVKVTIEDMIESFIDDTLDINSTHAISNRAVTNMFNSIQEIISSYDSQLVDMEHDIDNIETEISSVNVNLNNRINTTNSNLSQTAEALATETANRQSADNVLNSRINAIASLQQGSTTGDAELIDGRIGANGTTYQNIGSAIRGQIEPLNRVINNLNLNTGSTLEMGNITASDGSDIPSTKNFRLAGYLNPAVHTIKCEAWYQMALATYTPAGTFMNRSAFQYQTISNLDHVHYKYRVVFKMVNDDDIPAPDTVGTHFISEASELENNKSVYNDTLSIDIPFEQGNISAYDGSNVSSTTNIRSIYYIPNTVKSISADPGYVMAVSRRLKSDLSFVDRTNYNVTFYDTFDFDTYLYRVCLAKASSIETVTPTDKAHLKFNTATLDKIQRISSSVDNLAPAGIPLLNDYVNANGYKIMARSLMGLKTFEKFDSTGFDITDPTLQSHDATMCIINNKIYIVRAMYLTSDNAQAQDCKVVLTSANLDGSNLVNIDVAKYGDTLGGYSVTGGCGSPNLIAVGNDIHIFFTAGADNTYYIFHVAYDTSTSTFGTYAPITIDGNLCNVRNSMIFFDHVYSLYSFTGLQMNASIGYDGSNYYAGVCEGTMDPDGRGIVIKSSNLINWTIFSKIPSDLSRPVYEVACVCANNKVIVATRSDYKTRKGLLLIYNNSGEVLSSCYMLNGCTRPDLINIAGSILLLNSEDNARSGVSITAIDTSNLILSDMQYQACYNNSPIQYLRAFYDGVKLYGVCTYMNVDKYAIHVGEIDLNLVTYDQITTALDSLLS